MKLLGFGVLKWIGLGAGAAVLAAMLAMGVWLHSQIKANATLRANNAQLEESLASANKSLEAAERERVRIERLLAAREAAQRRAQADADRFARELQAARDEGGFDDYENCRRLPTPEPIRRLYLDRLRRAAHGGEDSASEAVSTRPLAPRLPLGAVRD